MKTLLNALIVNKCDDDDGNGGGVDGDPPDGKPGGG